jgi:hypothetical protein
VSSALAVDKRHVAAYAREGRRMNCRRAKEGEDSDASSSPAESRRRAAVLKSFLRRREGWKEVEVEVETVAFVFGRKEEGKYLRSDMVCV